tara:strand:- start:2108 stop:2956 length:849 start_codon:yes stop_codon:yes gene_type:complete
VARAVPKPKKISDFKPLFDNVAQTNHYQVRFGGFGFDLRRHLASKGIGPRFIGEDIGLLCSSAVIPGSAMATAQIRGDYQGVVENIAHARQFTQMSLEFYVDTSYKSLKFLEHWMEYIGSGSRDNDLDKSYNFRMKYPNQYKVDRTTIIKFERDYDKFIEYTFFGLFPMNLNNINVQYEGAQLLKCNAMFAYDRYVSGETTSKSWWMGTDRNNISDAKQNSRLPIRRGRSTFNPPQWINADLPAKLFQDQVGSNYAHRAAASAMRTLGGALLGQGTSGSFIR